ncbi:MAG: phosphoglycerate kinase [Ilumatobacteraceae bacterium]
MNDASGASHRAHAPIVGPPATLPVRMGRCSKRGRRPPRVAQPAEAAVRRRARRRAISDKLGVVEALLEVVDLLVIGGAMCFTFFAAQRSAIVVRADQVDTCARIPGGEWRQDPPA